MRDITLAVMCRQRQCDTLDAMGRITLLGNGKYLPQGPVDLRVGGHELTSG